MKRWECIGTSGLIARVAPIAVEHACLCAPVVSRVQDYEEKEYNVKGGKGYWELGKLGPDLETSELQAKREKAEKIKAMAAQVGGCAHTGWC